MSGSQLSPEKAHALILRSFEGRDKAYTPYSKFNVGAALLFDGGLMITGCNVENASYGRPEEMEAKMWAGACICAERTAMTKAVSEGHTKPLAVAVTSLLKTPDISPCGICRQFLREFAALDMPVYMVADGYPRDEQLPSFWQEGKDEERKKLVTLMTLEQLLPMSFGPDHLSR